MKQTLIVSNRGQLTLPANLRKRFGIKDGGAVILEERGNELFSSRPWCWRLRCIPMPRCRHGMKRTGLTTPNGRACCNAWRPAMMRVFLDANVLFTAAHNPRGKAAFVIELGTAGHFSLFTSDAAREEAERNLAAKYPDALPFLETLLARITLIAADLSAPFPDGLPAKDAVIFQAAVACRATHFLTGDLRHFGPFMNRPDMTCSIIIQT